MANLHRVECYACGVSIGFQPQEVQPTWGLTFEESRLAYRPIWAYCLECVESAWQEQSEGRGTVLGRDTHWGPGNGVDGLIPTFVSIDTDDIPSLPLPKLE